MPNEENNMSSAIDIKITYNEILLIDTFYN